MVDLGFEAQALAHLFALAPLFQLPTQKNLITTIKTKASVFNVINEKIILTLHLSPVAKTKVRNYLAMQTESLIASFKHTLKKG